MRGVIISAKGILVTTTLLAAVASGSAQTPQQPVPQPQAATSPSVTFPESKLRELVRQEIENNYTRHGQDILNEAKRSQHGAEMLLSVIRWVSAGWLAVVTLLFGVLAFIGWREYGAVRTAKQDSLTARAEAQTAAAESRAAAGQIKEAEKEVATASERIRAIDSSIAQALTDTEVRFKDLPEIERFGIVGEAPELPSPEDIVRYEDADILLVLADKNNSVEKSRLVHPLIRLGTYWRLLEYHSRAIARLQRATEIDPNSIDAYRGLCAALYGAAVRDRVSPREKARLLDHAQSACAKAQELANGDNDALAGVLFDQGWIYDERGEYQQAVSAYREAERLDVGGKRTNIHYNLAVTYAKWGKYQAALAELSKVIDKDDNWEDVQTDRDFTALRAHPTYGEEFRALVAQAKEKRRGRNTA